MNSKREVRNEVRFIVSVPIAKEASDENPHKLQEQHVFVTRESFGRQK